MGQTEETMEDAQSQIEESSLEGLVLSRAIGARELLAAGAVQEDNVDDHRRRLALLLYTVKDELEKDVADSLGQPWHTERAARGPRRLLATVETLRRMAAMLGGES